MVFYYDDWGTISEPEAIVISASLKMPFIKYTFLWGCQKLTLQN